MPSKYNNIHFCPLKFTFKLGNSKWNKIDPMISLIYYDIYFISQVVMDVNFVSRNCNIINNHSCCDGILWNKRQKVSLYVFI